MRAVAAITAVALLALPAGRAMAQTATQDIDITATVLNSCTINNVAVGTPNGTANIPVTGFAAGAVNTATITPTGSPFANVACNTASNLLLTSLNGGVENVNAPPAGFTNIINYNASATWNGATATINTAVPPTADAAEPGTAVATTAGTGNLVVTITPQANTLSLVTGTYNDTLRVTLTPQ